MASEQGQTLLSQMMANAMSSSSSPAGTTTSNSANNSSSSTTTTSNSSSAAAAAPASWRLELMMEKLRQKRTSLKPLQETAKNLRQALMERRCFLDANDKLQLQGCLDTLQQSIKVNSLSSMVERLDMVSRQLGLKLSPGANEQEWFISSDMFYLEVLIDSKGVVGDMKIQHEGKTEQLQCPDLIKSLAAQDFKDFSAHLQGLIAIYNLNADKHIKSKAFIALQALETDLAAMASTYSFETKADQMIMKHLLGNFQARRGGHAVKLTYYISPYEFFDKETKTCIPNEISEVVKRQIGTSAKVSIQGSPGITRKLQMSSNVTVCRSPDGKAMPRYGNLNSTNSTALPACFVLKLDSPIPIFKGLLNSIQSITGIENGVTGEAKPILNLVTQVVSDNQLDCSEEKGLFVSLPDQHHCYFMTETSGLEGLLLPSISFTLASQLPLVLATLRQQLMFNTLIGSCVRPSSKPESESLVFEVSALSHHNISVSFQHPLDDSLVTLEFDIRDVMLPLCRVHALYSTTPDMIPTLEEHACCVVRRSMSIPVTVRAVIRRWQSMRVKSDAPKPDSAIPAPSTSTTSTANPVLPLTAPSCGIESQQTAPSSFNKQMSYNAPAQTAPIDFISYMNNPIFASLSQNFQSQSQANNRNAQAQQVTPAAGHGPIPSSSVLQGLLDQNNPAKRRKRNKTSTEVQKSPLRQKSPIRQDEPGATPGWMSELGLEQDCRWNIDITPVSSQAAAAEELKRKFPVKRSVSLDSNVESDDRLPSLSITPVNSSAGPSTTVNSILASIRPGIEIIPLPNAQNPPNIPNSITVTPILPNSPDLKKIKKRVEETLEKKKVKKLDVKHITKSQQQGGKPSVSTMKSVSSPLPKPKKLTKPTLDITKKVESKLEKDKSLVIYQPPKTQAATQAVAAALAAAKTQQTPKKAGILDSVINKLKSAQGADCEGIVKKSEQMSTKDLLKASSSITDIVQKSASKINEYSVRTSSGLVPGGGLKLTINKALAPKFGVDMKKKTVLKRPLGQKPKPLISTSKDEPKRPLVKKEEMNKITDTRKLYMPSLEPGSLFKDSPKFDLKNFQIPKKSKPLEKVEAPTPPPLITPSLPAAASSSGNSSASSSSSDKNSAPPELTVEATTAPPPATNTAVATPPTQQATPPRQPTPQPISAAGPTVTPAPPAVAPPPTVAAQPKSVTPPPLVPANLSTNQTPQVPEFASSKPSEEPSAKPVEPTPPPAAEVKEPLPPTQPSLPAPKETIISPESPEPMDTSESTVTPQNIPTTPPTTVAATTEESQEKSAPAPAEPEGGSSSNAAPPRATTPAPPPRSVTPAPPSRSTTPAPVIPVTTTAGGTVTAPPPPARPPSVPPTLTPVTSAQEKSAPAPAATTPVEAEAASTLPPPGPDTNAVVSMHCIVKSPAPNSPMLSLRSPALIVQSPHTPFTIDDDLMDEALIGGGPSNSDKTAS